MHRDAQGNPTDEVRAAAAGTVVHASREARASNYGRYVVVEHRWDGSPFYTLYAHLASISVEPGQAVRQGETLGIMGFTGAGIDRERAHTHFEVCMMLSRNFEQWHAVNFPRDPNRHGIYNGLNLAGADPAALLLAAHKDPALKIADYIASAEPAFKITVKNSVNFFLIRAYPWLVARMKSRTRRHGQSRFRATAFQSKSRLRKRPSAGPSSRGLRKRASPTPASRKRW